MFEIIGEDSELYDGQNKHPSPVELFNRLHLLFENVLREAQREVYKNAVMRLSLERRMHTSTDSLIALNVG
jgi:hypothetical protein